MERRVIIFLAISLLLLTLYPYLVGRFLPPNKLAGPQPVPALPPAIQPASPPIAVSESRQGQPQAAVTAIATQMLPHATEQVITVETSLYRLFLTNHGAVITGWELKRYTTALGGPSVALLSFWGPGPLPLTISADGPGTESKDPLATGVYSVSVVDAPAPTTISLSAAVPVATLAFTYRDAATGRGAEKRLTFHNDDYLVDVDIAVSGERPEFTLSLGTNFGITEWTFLTGYAGPLTYVGNELKTQRVDKLDGEQAQEGEIHWAALQDRYFIAALIPRADLRQVVIRKQGDHRVSVGVHGSRSGQYTLYAGPKDYARLQALGARLEQSVDFGWFIWDSWGLVRLIAQPLFYILMVINRVTQNYGLTIVILTVLIRAAFIPVAHKSYKSFKGMQEIQPKLAALQKKYKDDKPRLNQETMALYKTHGVNPFGGCLPVLLQIPVFVAFYNILYTTIELRHAPFVWWIRDLSDKDPYYVLPVIMGLTMVLQQRMQPTTDPKQAQMMMAMSAIFTVMFLTFPAGLVLYWMVNNILGILQQFITMKYFAPKTAAT